MATTLSQTTTRLICVTTLMLDCLGKINRISNQSHFFKVFKKLLKLQSLIVKCKEAMGLVPELNETIENNLDLLNSTSELILIQHLAKYRVLYRVYVV